MKNKFSFLTLFSLILILGVYYITLPSDIFKNEKTQSVSSKVDINVSENNKLVALRVERDENASNVMAELQDKILSSSNSEEKSELFNELQRLNLSRGKETFLEDKIRDNLSITSLVEIKGDNISITIVSNEHNSKIANDIMRSVQEEFEDKKNIIVKFTS